MKNNIHSIINRDHKYNDNNNYVEETKSGLSNIKATSMWV